MTQRARRLLRAEADMWRSTADTLSQGTERFLCTELRRFYDQVVPVESRVRLQLFRPCVRAYIWWPAASEDRILAACFLAAMADAEAGAL